MWGCNETVSGGTGMTNAISVKDRLKKQAIEDGKTMQDKLVTFGLERTIYRVSVSRYAERFTLKGGIFLYALFEGEYVRATMDIDFLAQHISNDAEEMKKVFSDIFSIECDDALRFELKTLKVFDITKFKEYHGVNISIIKKKKALVKVEFEETMQLLRGLLIPIVDSIHKNESFEQIWSKETKSWKKKTNAKHTNFPLHLPLK